MVMSDLIINIIITVSFRAVISHIEKSPLMLS